MNQSNAIRVLISQSSPIFRHGLAAIIQAEPGMEVVAQAGNARETVAAFQEHGPDVAILDLRMPESECLNAIKAIRTESPQARILILTDYDGDEDIYRGLRAGASGYLLKSADASEVIEAVRALHAGQKRIAPAVAARLAERAGLDDLSESERAVLREMAAGKSNGQIAETLMISEGTVKFHVNNILLKLDVANRTEAVVSALKRGLVRLA